MLSPASCTAGDWVGRADCAKTSNPLSPPGVRSNQAERRQSSRRDDEGGHGPSRGLVAPLAPLQYRRGRTHPKKTSPAGWTASAGFGIRFVILIFGIRHSAFVIDGMLERSQSTESHFLRLLRATLGLRRRDDLR